MAQQYRIFDSHTHAFPEKIVDKAMEVLSGNVGFAPYHDGTLKALIEYEKEGQAEGFMILPIATRAGSVPSINDWAVEVQGGPVHSLGTIHPDYAEYKKEIERVAGLGLKGVKMHAEYQNFFVDEERVFPIYEALFKNDMILYLHAGRDSGYQPPVKASPRRIAAICDRFPNGKIVAAHMGGFLQYEEVEKYLLGRDNLWIDTSSAAQRMKLEEFVRLSRKHGVKKVLFGTDAPWSEFAQVRQTVSGSGLTHEELEDVFFYNAARLFGL